MSAPTYTLRYGPAPKQYADLRVPPGKGPVPIAVIVHGGCWDVSFGSSETIAPIADALTRRGIATLNVQYRLVGDPGGGCPGTMRDVETAIDACQQRKAVEPGANPLKGRRSGERWLIRNADPAASHST